MTAGTLFVVATPIGNLEDVTLRALRILREVDVIAAEDTRRTARLLSRHSIDTPTLSFHEHNTKTRLPQLMSRLRAGSSVAVVTDAGTPSISDPGVELVQACVKSGIPVDPIPGPSAPITAAVVSGFPLNPLTIFGFMPSRRADRARRLAELALIKNTISFFDTPHRIRETLAEASAVFGERPILVARELTKRHQELLRGSADAVLKVIGTPQGEFTVIVGPEIPTETTQGVVSDDQLLTEFGLMTQNVGVSRRAAIGELARRHRKASKEVYAAVERAKTSGK